MNRDLQLEVICLKEEVEDLKKRLSILASWLKEEDRNMSSLDPGVGRLELMIGSGLEEVTRDIGDNLEQVIELSSEEVDEHYVEMLQKRREI